MQVASIMDAAHDDDAPRTPPRGGADADIAEEVEGYQDDIESGDECKGDEEDGLVARQIQISQRERETVSCKLRLTKLQLSSLQSQSGRDRVRRVQGTQLTQSRLEGEEIAGAISQFGSSDSEMRRHGQIDVRCRLTVEVTKSCASIPALDD
jgi:hypothetical protein